MTATARHSAKSRARKALSKKTRFEVFKRDGFICQYCGSHPPKAILHVDHIVPVAKGGGNEMDNLVTSCDQCNSGKGAIPLSSVPMSLREKAARVKESEEQLAAYAEVMRAKKHRMENDCWEVAEPFMRNFKQDWMRPQDLLSIRRFLESIASFDAACAMETAIGKFPYSRDKAFRYFCGICWRLVREQGAT